MTLIVSLRIPDGIVIAGDSLLTLMKREWLDNKTDVTCPECNHKHEIRNRLQTPPTPATTFPHTQKVFPFCGKFGVGIYEPGLLANKPVYSVMRLFEQNLKEQEKSFDSVTEIAEKISLEIHNLLKEQWARENTLVDTLPEDQIFLGFQVVGYDGIEPKTINVLIGKNARCEVLETFGCTASGSQEVVQAIWDLYKKNPDKQPPYNLFSLQDAVDYAEFLIDTTITHQRFALMNPNVGGDIDIAVITPFDGFQWIRQKSLGKILEGQ